VATLHEDQCATDKHISVSPFPHSGWWKSAHHRQGPGLANQSFGGNHTVALERINNCFSIQESSILKAKRGFHFSYFNHVTGSKLALGDHFFSVDLDLGPAL